MMQKLTLAALAAGAMICVSVPSHAAALSSSPAGKTLSGPSLIETVQYRRYCRRWHRECRARWGWGWRFRRCMRRHGC